MSLRDMYECVSELFPNKAQWAAKDVPDLTGKTMIVTGANSGVGLETARVLLQNNAKVYITCRSSEKAEAAVQDLSSSTGKGEDLHVLLMDLSSLPSVKAAVDEFLRTETRLAVVFANAGIMWPAWELLGPHRHDLQFATNVLGHFYLIQLLLPTLLATAQVSPDKHTRIVHVSSNGHWIAPTGSQGGPIRYETLVDGPARRKWNQTGAAYNQTKIANVLFSNALARKYGDRGIISTSLNPGGLKTNLQRNASWLTRWIMEKTILWPASWGAISSLYAGTSPEGLGLNGKYLIPWATVKEPRADTKSIEHQERLWTWCEEEIKKYAPAN